MAFYKRFFAKINQKWYPRVVTWGKPVSTKQLAKDLANGRTVTAADVYAVLAGLSDVMSMYMAQGRTVKLDGVGTFYYSANTNKNGVDSADNVSARQINSVRVVFLPEREKTESGAITRSLTQHEIVWELWGAEKSKSSSSGGSTSGASSDSGNSGNTSSTTGDSSGGSDGGGDDGDDLNI